MLPSSLEMYLCGLLLMPNPDPNRELKSENKHTKKYQLENNTYSIPKVIENREC